MKERKQYTKEFKQGAVRLVTEQGRTVGDAAQSLGISPWTRVAVDQGGPFGGGGRLPWARAAHSPGAGELRAAAES